MPTKKQRSEDQGEHSVDHAEHDGHSRKSSCSNDNFHQVTESVQNAAVFAEDDQQAH